MWLLHSKVEADNKHRHFTFRESKAYSYEFVQSAYTPLTAMIREGLSKISFFKKQKAYFYSNYTTSQNKYFFFFDKIRMVYKRGRHLENR